MLKFTVLIPAYNPGTELLALVEQLLVFEISAIIIVNDGSNNPCQAVFSNLRNLSDKIVVLDHAVNLGKGAALKTGLHYVYTHFNRDIGVITADADGQHSAQDILQVGRKLLNCPHDLIVGVRTFSDGKKIPLRSRFGNVLTKKLFKFVVGQSVTDTQSGLRGIPLEFIPQLLKINSNGYEFELSMLIACKYSNRRINEISITTIYINNNSSSHFNPVLDSLKIYFVLFRFSLLSLTTSCIDFSIFALLSMYGVNIIMCQLASRTASVMYNYPLVKRIVFHCNEDNKNSFAKYIALVIANGVISLTIIHLLVSNYAIKPLLAKISVESLIFIANFTIQRDFIFTKKIN